MLSKCLKPIFVLITLFLSCSYIISLCDSLTIKDGFFFTSIIYIIITILCFTDESPTARDRYKFDKYNHFI